MVLSSALDPAELLAPFRAFDAGFPLLCAGLPHSLLRSAVAARNQLAAAMLSAQESAPERLAPLTAARRNHFRSGGVSERETAALNAIVMWPLHANTAPTVFWALAYALADGDAAAAAQREADAFLARHPGFPGERAQPSGVSQPARASQGVSGGLAEGITAALLDAELPVITACCLEALRLAASSFLLRIVVQETVIPLVSAAPGPGPQHLGPQNGSHQSREHVPQQVGHQKSEAEHADETEPGGRSVRVFPGTRVFMAPLHHRDERRFPDAGTFRHSRFLPTAQGGGGCTARDLVPFGGGVSMCALPPLHAPYARGWLPLCVPCTYVMAQALPPRARRVRCDPLILASIALRGNVLQRRRSTLYVWVTSACATVPGQVSRAAPCDDGSAPGAAGAARGLGVALRGTSAATEWAARRAGRAAAAAGRGGIRQAAPAIKSENDEGGRGGGGGGGGAPLRAGEARCRRTRRNIKRRIYLFWLLNLMPIIYPIHMSTVTHIPINRLPRR